MINTFFCVSLYTQSVWTFLTELVLWTYLFSFSLKLHHHDFLIQIYNISLRHISLGEVKDKNTRQRKIVFIVTFWSDDLGWLKADRYWEMCLVFYIP